MLSSLFKPVSILVVLSILSLTTCSKSDVFSELNRESLRLKIVSVYPENGTSDVPVNSSVSVTFNMPVDSSTIEKNISVSADGSEVKGSVTSADNVVTFDPDTDFSKDVTIKVKIDNGIRSLKNFGMDRGFEWSFSTGAYVDKIPPVVSGNPVAMSVRSTGFEIRWTAATDNVTPSEEMDYLVYISVLPTGLGSVTPIKVHGRCQYSLQGLSPSTVRYFSVTAVDTAGNASPYKQYSYGLTSSRYPFVVTDGEVHATALDGSTLYFGGLFNYAGIPVKNTTVINSLTGETSSAVVNPLIDGSVNVAVSDGIGGWYIGGSITSVNGLARNNIVRINSDGSVHDFNPDVVGQITAIAVSSDSKYVYFSGNLSSVNGKTGVNIAKVDSFSGKIVSGWSVYVSGYAKALEISGTYLYVGGSFSQINGESISHLARIDINSGKVDSSWNPKSDNPVLCLDITGSSLYAGGSFNNIGGEARSKVAEIRLTDGKATTWAPSPDSTVFAIASDPYSDYVYMGGDFSTVSGSTRNRICEVSKTTGLVESWSGNTGTDVSSSRVMCITLFGGGVYFGGKFTSVNGKTQRNASCVMHGGSVDSLWKNGFDGGEVSSIAFNSDGSGMLVCGIISASMWPRSNAAAYDISTGELTDWDPKTNGMVKAIAVGNNAVYIGGSFTEVGYDSSNTHLAKTNRINGSVEDDGGSKWYADGNVNSLLIDPSETNIYIGGPFTKIKSVSVSNAEGYVLSSGNRMTGWNNYLTASNMTDVNSLIWFNPSSSVFVGGMFEYIIVSPAVDISNFGKCSSSGSLDTTYDTNVPDVVQTACTDNASMVIVAGNGFINSYNTGSAASGWSKTLISSDKDVFAMQYLSSGKLYVGGNFSYTEGSITRNYLSRFDVTSSGQPLENWGPSFDQAGVYAISAGTDMIVVGGSFNAVGGQSHKGIAAIDITTGAVWE